MKSGATSLKVFGIYMMLIPGLGLMIVPDFMLNLFQLSHGEELWMPRMIGLLAFLIGAIDYSLANYQLDKMYKLTVMLRYLAAAFMIGLWITDEVEIMILMFAAVDALGATWTWLIIKDPVTT